MNLYQVVMMQRNRVEHRGHETPQRPVVLRLSKLSSSKNFCCVDDNEAICHNLIPQNISKLLH